MKDDKVYLGHIIEAIEAIARYTKGMTFKDFADNDMTVDAVVRRLQVIGEAANNLSAAFSAAHAEITLRDAVAMRNFLVHEYFGVSLKIVWDTCQNDLPRFAALIRQVLSAG
jgi:uncharacterized protein with HEPN domain